MATRIFANLSKSRTRQFWFLQLIGWTALTVVAFIVGPVWYGFQNPVLDISVVVVQSIAGLLLTIPQRFLYQRLWNADPIVRLGISIFAVVLFSIIWTYLKMKIYYTAFPSDTVNTIWRDFGGWLYVAIVVMAGWTTLYYGIRYYQLAEKEHELAEKAIQQARDARISQLEMETVAQDAQLRMLRYQINPHFLFNTLNAACALVQAQRLDAVQQMLVQLSNFFRYSLETDPVQPVILAKEVEAALLYLDIEKSRFGEMLRTDFKLDESARDAQVPSLLLQPLFENAIKFAVSENPEGGTIGFRASRQIDRLHLHIWDDGPGDKMESISDTSGAGVGLKNIQDRLKHFAGIDYRFATSTDSGGGFHVKIELPYISDSGGEYETA